MNLKEVDARLAKGELPSKLAKEAWERKLAIVQNQHIETSDDLDDIPEVYESYCALCRAYFNKHDECSKCPLGKIDPCRESLSSFEKTCDCATYEELVTACKNMLAKIDESIVIELENKK